MDFGMNQLVLCPSQLNEYNLAFPYRQDDKEEKESV